MPKLEIPDVPKHLYKWLRDSARRKGIPLGEEAVAVLAKGAANDDAREAALLAETRRGRRSLKGVYVTEADLQAAKQRGRP
jgi:hypothetical protein